MLGDIATVISLVQHFRVTDTGWLPFKRRMLKHEWGTTVRVKALLSLHLQFASRSKVWMLVFGAVGGNLQGNVWIGEARGRGLGARSGRALVQIS